MSDQGEGSLLSFDFRSVFPHKSWVSNWANDEEYPRYKLMSARHEDSDFIEFLVVLQEREMGRSTHCRIINLTQDPPRDTLSMKLQIEKPPESKMKFFTPELYMRFNSSDPEEADRANEEWDAAIRAYQSHLNDIREKMPSQVRKLSELCLHDSELLAFNQDIEPFVPLPVEPLWPSACPYWSAVAMFALKQAREILSLIYVLWDRVGEYPRKSSWKFSKSRKHWLYDEIDLANQSRGMFLHRILFSDGAVFEIPFLSVFTYSFPTQNAHARKSTKESA